MFTDALVPLRTPKCVCLRQDMFSNAQVCSKTLRCVHQHPGMFPSRIDQGAPFFWPLWESHHTLEVYLEISNLRFEQTILFLISCPNLLTATLWLNVCSTQGSLPAPEERCWILRGVLTFYFNKHRWSSKWLHVDRVITCTRLYKARR